LENTISELEKNHLQEKANITLEHQKEINNLTLFDEEYHMKISDHEKEMNKIRGNCLKLRVNDSNNNLRQIGHLERLGRLGKFMNKDKDILSEMKQYNQKIVDEDAIDVHYNLIDNANANNDE